MTIYEVIHRANPLIANGFKPGAYIEFAVKVAADGWRPKLPEDWNESISKLIMACWEESPESRPDFCNIINILEHVLLRCKDLTFSTPHFGNAGMSQFECLLEMQSVKPLSCEDFDILRNWIFLCTLSKVASPGAISHVFMLISIETCYLCSIQEQTS